MYSVVSLLLFIQLSNHSSTVVIGKSKVIDMKTSQYIIAVKGMNKMVFYIPVLCLLKKTFTVTLVVQWKTWFSFKHGKLGSTQKIAL